MAVKFPLEMRDGVQVRNISELKENFDVEKVVGYFVDGKLKKWLDARWYESESEEIDKLNADDPLLAQQLCEVFGIEFREKKINTEEIAAKNARISKLKQYTDDEEIIKSVDVVVFNQEELADLYDRDVKKIYLCEGLFKIPKSKRKIQYEVIGEAKVEGLENQEIDKELERKSLYQTRIPEELADLIFCKNYIELKDYLVWTDYGRISEQEKINYQKYFANKKAKTMNNCFKAWNKKTDEYFSFDIPSIMLPRIVGDFFSYDNKIFVTDFMNNGFWYDVERNSIEKSNKKIFGNGMCLVKDAKYVEYSTNDCYVIHNFNTKEAEKIKCKSTARTYIYADNKLFYFRNRTICVLNTETQEDKVLYDFGEKDVAPSFCKLVFFDGELFVLYELYGKSSKTLIGIKMDGSIKEYFQMSNATVCHMLYDERLCNKSQYLVFEKADDIYVFDMQSKEMKEYKECTSILTTRVVGSYLYIYTITECKRYRVDLKSEWNPIDIGRDYERI